MAHTDKDQPYRLKMVPENNGTHADQPSYRERGSAPSAVRFAKREASKARRRGNEDPRMLQSLRFTYKYNVG